jgi:hypothetical protein
MMPDALTASVKVNFSGSLINTLTNSLAAPSALVEAAIAMSLTDGTAADKADKLWASKSRALVGATSETLDLYDLGSVDIGAGAGKDPLGGTLALVEIVAILIYNSTSSTGTLTIGADGTTAAWNSIFNGDDEAAVTVKPGGFFAIGSPTDPAYAVADTSNHLLKIASSANLTYDIYVLGRSA